jgi:hypothetical protein
MKNIHIIPTDKPSRLWKNNLLQGKLELSEEVLPYNTSQNIYITSDEEIKEGDWFMSDFNSFPIHNIKELSKREGTLGWEQKDLKNNLKIILTTDQDLINDGVQAIDNDFLEWFVAHPSCEFVEVEKFRSFKEIHSPYEYMIIIPKEETKQEFPQFGTKEFNDLASTYFGGKPKQETLEEFAKQEAIKQYSEDTFGNLIVRKSIEKGIKYQQEQDKNKYSEEDMIEFVEWIANTKLHGHSKQLYEAMIRYKVETTKKLFKLWFEQFKIKGDYERKYKVSIHQILEQSKKK